MIHNVLLHNRQLLSKEACTTYAAFLKKTFLNGHQCQIAPSELLKQAVDGYSFVPGSFDFSKDSLTQQHWQSQSIFALDIDNLIDDDIAPDECYLDLGRILSISNEHGIMPFGVYETYSSMPSHLKYRVLFQLDEPAVSLDEFNRVATGLYAMFDIEGNNVVDSRCVYDRSRIYFPGKEIVYEDDSNVVSKHLFDNTIVPEKNVTKSYISTSINKPYVEPAYHFEINEKMVYAQRKRLAVVTQLAANPCGSKAHAMSSTVGTELFNKIIKEYCSTNGETAVTLGGVRMKGLFFTTAKYYPLHLLFGKQLGEKFSCILPGHDDHNPSACFEQHPNGTYHYHCYSCKDMGSSKYIDIFGLLSKILNVSHKEAVKKLYHILGIQIETEYEQKMKLQLVDYEDYLYLPNIAEAAPELASFLGERNNDMYRMLRSVLQEARQSILDEEYVKSSELLCFLSVRRLAERYCIDTGSKLSTSKVSQKMHYLALLGLIKYKSNDEVDKRIVEKSYNMIFKQSSSDGVMRKYRVNYISIPDYSVQTLIDAERKHKELRSKKIYPSQVSHKFLEAMLSKEVADEHYVQAENEDYFKEKNFVRDAHEVVGLLINKYGYCTRDMVMKHQRFRSFDKATRIRLRPYLLSMVAATDDFAEVKYRADYRDKFKISARHIKERKMTAGATIIIVRTADVIPIKSAK